MQGVPTWAYKDIQAEDEDGSIFLFFPGDEKADGDALGAPWTGAAPHEVLVGLG